MSNVPLFILGGKVPLSVSMADKAIQLDYARPSPRPRRWGPFAAGAALGFLLSGFLYLLLTEGGPILPLTFLLSPIGIVIELVSLKGWAGPAVVVGGSALLFGLYATLPITRRPLRNLGVALVFRLLCFAVAMALKRGML